MVEPAMQSVLISALTAAIVTLFIEYCAKPHLEARKDRVVETHRLRRDLLARLLTLTNLQANIGALTHPQSWEIGKAALYKTSSEAIKLRDDFAKLFLALTGNQQLIATKLIRDVEAVAGKLVALVLIMEAENLVAVDGPDQEIRVAELILKAVDRIKIATDGAFSVLSVRRRRPWRYYSILRFWSNAPLPELPSLDRHPEGARAAS